MRVPRNDAMKSKDSALLADTIADPRHFENSGPKMEEEGTRDALSPNPEQRTEGDAALHYVSG